MGTCAKATIRLRLASQKQLSTLLSALTPEANARVSRRSNVRISKNDSFLTLIVEAEDSVALRATLNAYLRWVDSAIDVIDLVERA